MIASIIFAVLIIWIIKDHRAVMTELRATKALADQTTYRKTAA